MASRTIRYPSKIILESQEIITGKKANIVFKDGRVLFALVLMLKESKLVILNMRNKKQEINIDQINEIIIDSKV